jgi:hypothetical protein
VNLLKSLLSQEIPVSQKERGEFAEICHDFFCVCDGCDEILPFNSITICPYCHSYNFNPSSRAVKIVAKKMQHLEYECYSTFIQGLYKR